MEDLSSKMAHHPRYWKRLITVLSKTIEREDTPGLIIQVRIDDLDIDQL